MKTREKSKSIAVAILMGAGIGMMIAVIVIILIGCSGEQVISYINRPRPPSVFEHSPEEYRK